MARKRQARWVEIRRTLRHDGLGFMVKNPSLVVFGASGRIDGARLLAVLERCHGNRTHAANILGISIRTLRNKLNEYADGGLPITPAGMGPGLNVSSAESVLSKL